ncbi:MAG TPA: hypothetical protein VNT79_02650 [Phycisphaerae bacterium]|nr:hypothetical protein [Phycisphaerae bacterium]
MPAVAGMLYGQTTPPARADASEQIKELNNALGPEHTASTFPELSRLLSDPHDQVYWLVAKAEDVQATDGKAARIIAEAADTRIKNWKDRVIIDESLVSALKRILLRPLIEIIVPEELARRLEELGKAGFDDEVKSDTDKFTLFSRGVPRSVMGWPSKSTSPYVAAAKAGDTIATPLNAARGSELPNISTLLERANELAGAAADSSADNDPDVKDAISVTSALLDRAIGVDGEDRGNSDNLPEHWNTLAGMFQDKNLWRWAGLARLLQSMTTTDKRERAETLSAANALLARSKAVEDGLPDWAKQGKFKESAWGNPRLWSDRLAAESMSEASLSELPLSPDFREVGRVARGNAESAFIQTMNGGSDEERFQAMQKAKWADLPSHLRLGRTPPTLSRLKMQLFNDPTRIKKASGVPFIYFELLESGDVGSKRYDALLLYCENPTQGPDDTHSDAWISNRATADEAVGEALARIPYRDRGDVRWKIILAPDGSTRSKTWSNYDNAMASLISAKQLNAVNSAEWLYYIPTAGALIADEGSPWDMESSLRVWYLSLVRTRQESQLSTSPSSLAPPSGTKLSILRLAGDKGIPLLTSLAGGS